MSGVVNVIIPMPSSRLKYLLTIGWKPHNPERVDRGDGFAHLTRTFDSNREIKEQLDVFADNRLTAWVSR